MAGGEQAHGCLSREADGEGREDAGGQGRFVRSKGASLEECRDNRRGECGTPKGAGDHKVGNTAGALGDAAPQRLDARPHGVTAELRECSSGDADPEEGDGHVRHELGVAEDGNSALLQQGRQLRLHDTRDLIYACTEYHRDPRAYYTADPRCGQLKPPVHAPHEAEGCGKLHQ
jgi:hypothetical protein